MSASPKTLLLTGATGFIGSHIATHFAAKGWNVVALVRGEATQKTGGVSRISYDLISETLPVFPEQVDVFIHAGYIKNTESKNAFELNAAAASRLLNALTKTNTVQKIFLSSLSADKNAESVYGRQKATIEDLFLAENGTVIRAGMVIGNGGLFAATREYLKVKSIIPLFGKGDQPLQTIDIDDLVVAIEKIIAKNIAGKLVVATDEAVPYKEFYSELCRSLGKEPRFVKIPFGVASFGMKLREFSGMKLPVTSDNLLGLKRMKKIPSSADLQKIGITLRNYKESFAGLTK